MSRQELAFGSSTSPGSAPVWMDVLRLAFSRRWLLATFLVLIGVGINIRLGIWQLDRLEQRRAFNRRAAAQLAAEPLELTPAFLQGETSAEALLGMQYRQVSVTGVYDHTREIAIRNQYHQNLLGVSVVSPLQIQGTDQVILVNRGWVPLEDYTDSSWQSYPERGVVTVTGMLRGSQAQPTRERLEDPIPVEGEFLPVWSFITVERIARQLPYEVLPVYVQQAPGTDPASSLPVRSLPDIEINEGSHFSYALQWFMFGTLLGVGYPFFIRNREHTRQRGIGEA